MNRPCRTSLAIVLLLAALAALLSGGALAADAFSATGYTVTDQNGASLSSVEKGDAATVTVFFKAPGIATDSLAGVSDISVSRPVQDSFSGGSAAVSVTSSGSDPLEFSVAFQDMVYSGSGNAFRFMVACQGASQAVEFAVKEAVEYVPPTASPAPTDAPEPIPAPMVLVSRSDITSPLAAGQSLTFTVSFKNLSSATLQSPVASFTPPDALVVAGDSQSFVLGDIAPGATGSVQLTVQASGSITAASQTIGVDLRFNYNNGVSLTQGSISDKVVIPSKVPSASSGSSSFSESGSSSGFSSATETVKPDAPVPNLIVSAYSAGDNSIAAGDTFTLSFTFKNTGTLKVENIVATVDGGESFVMDGSTNTFFYSSLAAGAEQNQKVPLQAIASAKTGAQSITVSFKYEYVDGSKRAASTADIKLSVQVYQPDRFELNDPVASGDAVAGQELAVSLTYVNKGKSDISNVEATVEGSVDTPAKTQYLGNIESGKSGTIGFAVTPTAAGSVDLKFVISYEDGNQQVKTKSFPLTLTVQDAPAETQETGTADSGTTAGQTSSSGSRWIWIAAAAALILAGTVTGLVLKRRKAKNAAAPAAETWDDWGDEDEPQAPENAGSSRDTRKGV